MPQLNSRLETPPSVGYAVTQMIHSGMLDDCLHLIERAARARRAILARDRFNRPATRLAAAVSVPGDDKGDTTDEH